MAVEMAATRRLFTRAEYYRMAEVGILKPTDRVELIHGEIVTMAPMGRKHRACVSNLTRLCVTRVNDRAIVDVQLPIVLADRTELQPDIAIYRLRSGVPYKQREPRADDAIAIIEVADTSLGYDRTIKMRLYAAAGIPEYFVIDANAETADVYRDPAPDGYRAVERVGPGGRIALQAFPDVILTLAEIFA